MLALLLEFNFRSYTSKSLYNFNVQTREASRETSGLLFCLLEIVWSGENFGMMHHIFLYTCIDNRFIYCPSRTRADMGHCVPDTVTDMAKAM